MDWTFPGLAGLGFILIEFGCLRLDMTFLFGEDTLILNSIALSLGVGGFKAAVTFSIDLFFCINVRIYSALRTYFSSGGDSTGNLIWGGLG